MWSHIVGRGEWHIVKHTLAHLYGETKYHLDMKTLALSHQRPKGWFVAGTYFSSKFETLKSGLLSAPFLFIWSHIVGS